MAEIDPITQEALRRASRMYNRGKPQGVSRPHSEPKPLKKEPEPDKKPAHEKPRVHNNHEHKEESDPIKAFFKDKEESIILLLVMLLMDENADPSLLLALMYLLI